jgi:hypothetical protein
VTATTAKPKVTKFGEHVQVAVKPYATRNFRELAARSEEVMTIRNLAAECVASEASRPKAEEREVERS